MNTPLLFLQLLFAGLALRMEWWRLLRCQRLNKLPLSSWNDFEASQRPRAKPLALEGSWDSVQDFEDMLREEKASFVLVILRPHAAGVKASVVMREEHFANFVPAFNHAGMELQRAVLSKVLKDAATKPPGEEWKG